MINLRTFFHMVLPGVIFALSGAMLPSDVQAKSFTVLYTFSGGTDGGNPAGGLIADSAGNLYGTAQAGGSENQSLCYNSSNTTTCGVVFKVATNGAETVLYNFCSQPNCADGNNPVAGLAMDKTGNLYGTTPHGGAGGAGTVFKLAPNGTATVLYSFCALQDCTDGGYPQARLLIDKSGNIFGTTAGGGAGGVGTVFEIATSGVETVLHSFSGTDGFSPYAGLIEDKAGNLYGTTVAGGNTDCGGDGCGTVFKIAADGSETVLYNFCSKTNCVDGETPYSDLIADDAGNLYGTTMSGGTGQEGTVFELSPSGKENVLYAFVCSKKLNCPAGVRPMGGLIADKKGNLYGTASAYGPRRDSAGTVFKIAKDGTETTLFDFTTICAKKGCPSGWFPNAPLLSDKKGNLFGTAFSGGKYEAGTVFTLKE